MDPPPAPAPSRTGRRSPLSGKRPPGRSHPGVCLSGRAGPDAVWTGSGQVCAVPLPAAALSAWRPPRVPPAGRASRWSCPPDRPRSRHCGLRSGSHPVPAAGQILVLYLPGGMRPPQVPCLRRVPDTLSGPDGLHTLCDPRARRPGRGFPYRRRACLCIHRMVFCLPCVYTFLQSLHHAAVSVPAPAESQISPAAYSRSSPFLRRVRSIPVRRISISRPVLPCR